MTQRRRAAGQTEAWGALSAQKLNKTPEMSGVQKGKRYTHAARATSRTHTIMGWLGNKVLFERKVFFPCSTSQNPSQEMQRSL